MQHGWAPPPWAPPPWQRTGPVAPRGTRFGARVVDAIVEAALVVGVLLVVPLENRPATAVAIAWFVVAAYETVLVRAAGGTLGKLATGLRVTALDGVDHPGWAAAARRGAVDAVLFVLPPVGTAAWAASSLSDPLGRGIPDRAASTMVVPKDANLPIRATDLPGYADGARPPRLTTLGRVGDLDVRFRARLRRLDDSPLLAVAVGLLALAAALPISTTAVIVSSSLAWVVVFVIDETRQIRSTGTTAGHRRAGLVVLDRRTGRPPRLGRSLARAVVLGLTLYLFPLWWLLAVSLAMMRWNRTGRGLHDLAGGTVVVADPSLDPETQRQRAMRLRLGRVG